MTHDQIYRRQSLRLQWIAIACVAAVGLPGIVLRLTGTYPTAWLGAIIFGLAIWQERSC
jgi:hypothetical protein